MRCPKCLREFSTDVMKSRHHILPTRWFKRQKDAETIKICRKCHDDLEILIQREEKGKRLRWMRYYELVNEFLGYRLLEV